MKLLKKKILIIVAHTDDESFGCGGFIKKMSLIYYYKKIPMNNINILNLAIFIQVLLGIITLLTGVEIKYASVHQLGSIFVLLSFLFIYYKNTN